MKTKPGWPFYTAAVVGLLLLALLFVPAGGATNLDTVTCVAIHVVQPNETASAIAAMYGITVSQLAAANNLANPNVLLVGQKLCIPSVSAPPPANGSLGICVTGQVIDKEHKGIAGLQVVAQTDNQPGIATKTDPNGMFSFSDLTPGLWTFRVQVPDSWKPVTPAEFSVELAYGHGTCYAVRFKLEPLGCIIATKVDANGYPVQNWKIKLVGVTDPEKYTDETGTARFDGLTPGNYIVSEEVPYPWKPLSPTSVNVAVHAAWDDNDCARVEFKNELQPTTCITGYKVDEQHRGLAGWKIFAQPVGGGPTFTTQTAEDGSFTFSNLTLGTWKVWEEVQQWWTPITPASFEVTLTQPGDQCVQVRFKNRPPDLCAEGYKVDENGVGLVGWTVTAYPQDDPTMRMTTTTDPRGYYRFNGLTLGKWVFEVEHKVGWTPITPDSVVVNITGGKYCTQVPTFRNRSPRGCIEGYKRDDLQVGLPGWNISLQPVGGGQYMHQLTDGTGYFRFDNLPVGKYEVWEEMQPGWAPLTPTKYIVEVVPSDEKICSQVEFVNKQVARDICIDGYKLDRQGNVGLPGFVITAKELATGEVQTATTDGLGYFRFSNLNPGKYEVSVTEQEGWVPVGPTSQVVTVSWPPKLECVRVKFYDRQPGPQPPGCRYWHVVQKGQTLSGLAAWYGVTLDALMAANGITNPNMIFIGQKLCIP
jgi:LysM repeat protein